MDPNLALERARSLIEDIDLAIDNDVPLDDLANQLVDVFTGLDDWLCKKGFLPKDWAR